MPAPIPQDFHDDVVRVARNREDGVTSTQTANPYRNETDHRQSKPRRAEDLRATGPGCSTHRRR